MTEEDEIKEYLRSLIVEGVAQESTDARGLHIYALSNKIDATLKGEIVVGGDGEIAFCTFAGLTNRKYMRGEGLDLQDLKAFVQAVQRDTPKIGKTLFGKKKIVLHPSGIVFNQGID